MLTLHYARDNICFSAIITVETHCISAPILTSYYTVLDFIHECLFFAHFHGKLAKLKIFHAKCRNFLLNLIILNNKKNIKNKNLPKIFPNLKKKVVPAITDICTGGQQCKFQLLGSGVISVIIFTGVIFFVIVLTKYEGCRYHSKILHTHTSWHCEVTVKFATRNALLTELIQFYIPTY